MKRIELDDSERFVIDVALTGYIAMVQGNKDWSGAEKAAAIATAEMVQRKVR